MRKHYIDSYLAEAQHKITVNLIGAGGTGSHMLSNLAMISKSMLGLGRQPLFVRVFDPDIVDEHNIGRQIFSPADIGRYKSEVLVSRLNRFYGFEWVSMPERFEKLGGPAPDGANIVISCVDSVKSRKAIAYVLKQRSDTFGQYTRNIYWLDIGNAQQTGQIILGTVRKIKQPTTYSKGYLPWFTKEFPDAKDDENLPSCSMAESLANQDLFVNKMLATYAGHMLWDLLRDYFISYRGIYVNLKDMKVSKVPL